MYEFAHVSQPYQENHIHNENEKILCKYLDEEIHRLWDSDYQTSSVGQ